MNIFILIAVGAACFVAGWLASMRTMGPIGDFVNNAEQAIEFVENMDTSNIDMMNLTLNQNRDAQASLDIQTLSDLEKGDIESAKERLINSLAEDYLDIKEDDAHEMRSLESKNVVKRIEELSDNQESFQKIIQESGWVE